jgi:predicted MPP superfamily phosphohydrolase
LRFLFLVFLALYFLLTFYIAYNGWVWLHKSFSFRFKKSWFGFVFLSSIAYFAGEFTDNLIFLWWGSVWLLVVFYGVILIPLLNILYFVLKKRGIRIMGFSISVFFLFVFFIGSYNAWHTYIKNYDITIHKTASIKHMKILMVTDIHLNKMIGNSRINNLLTIANKIKPDIILLPGDVVDGSMEPFIEEKMGKNLAQLKAPMGVYAILGNHEYYGGGVSLFKNEMKKIGVPVLTDDVQLVKNSFYLVGRKDYTDKKRKSIAQLVSDLDQTKPIIVMDHQPGEYSKMNKAGADLDLSGHTHRGQLFPANLITHALYENDWGYLKKGNLQTIVSSGYGLWGPPFRIGSQSEVVVINVTFAK